MNMKRMMMFSLLSIGLLLAGGCRRGGETPAVPPVAVRTAQVTVRDFQESVSTQGVIEAVNGAVISALVNGRIERLNVEESDRVRAGDVLFISDRSNLENARVLAMEALKIARERSRTRQADLELAKFSLVHDESHYHRNRTLYEKGSVSSANFETVTLTYQRAKLAVTQAEAALATARAEIDFAAAALAIADKKLADATVTAPFDGVVTAKLHRKDEFCAAGAPVLKLERPGSKRICAVLSAVHYGRVTCGRTRIEVNFGGRVLGVFPVTLKSASIEEKSRTFEVKADLPPEFALPSGTLCGVRVIMDERRAAALPEESLLFRRDGRFVVFAIESGRAVEIPVRPGITVGGWTELPDPRELQGREIIVSGQYFVNHGTPVAAAGK